MSQNEKKGTRREAYSAQKVVRRSPPSRTGDDGLELFVCFFMQTHEKETQLGNYVWCAKSVFVRQFPPRATRVLKQQQHVV